MARIEGVDPDRTERRVRAVLEAQAGKLGAPLLDPKLVALVNRRVAALNGRVF